MRGLNKLAWAEIKIFLREPYAFFFSLVFPLMLLFLFGGIYGNKPTPFFGGYGSVDISVPCYMALLIATNGLLSIAINMASSREYGILRRYRATPLRPHTILAAHVAVIFLMLVLGTALLILSAIIVFGLRFNGNASAVAAGFLLSSLSFFSLGFVLASIMPTARSAQVVAMVLFYPMIFLSGASIPREILPVAVRRAAEFLPLTHVVTLLRGLWIGDGLSPHLKEILILSVLLIVGAAVSAKTFRWE